MSRTDVVLHVGMQQSGAGMLQRALSQLRPQLRERGIAYVGQRQIGGLEHARGWQTRAKYRPADSGAFDGELADLVTRERRSTAAAAGGSVRAVLLSSDHLLGSDNLGPVDAETFRPFAVPAIRQLLAALDANRARIVLHTHRQDRLMEFCYLRSVQNGAHHEFAEQFPYRFEPVLDYVELIERIAAIPGVGEVKVRPYEVVAAGPRVFVADFLDAAGLADTLDLGKLPDDLRPRVAYSKLGLNVALAMNPHLDTDKERALVSGFVFENFTAKDDEESRFLPAPDRRRILDAYRDRNRELFARYLPGRGAGYASQPATVRLAELAAERAARPARGRELAQRASAARRTLTSRLTTARSRAVKVARRRLARR